MKGLVSIILSGTMLAAVFTGTSVTANALEDDIIKGFEIELLDDNTVEIDDYVGLSKKVVIPEKLGGYTVTSIGSNAFNDNTKIKSVTIPDTVTEIGLLAFSGCTNLEEIIIPDSVKSVGCSLEDSVFYKNEDNWEDGALYVGNHLLSTKYLVDENFKRDKFDQEEFKVREGTVSISPIALNFDAKKITIPASVRYIDDLAITYIVAAEISVASGNKHYYSKDGVLFETASNTLLRYPPNKPETEYTIPNGVTKLGENSFSHCSLTNLTIPDSVTSFGDSSFSNCYLPKLTISKNVTELGTMRHTIFGSKCNMEEINVDSNNEIYYSVDGVLFEKATNYLLEYPSNKPQTEYKIPEDVTELNLYSFRGAKLKKLTIPSSVSSITVTSISMNDDFYVEELNVDSKNEFYYSVDGVLFEKESNTLIKYPSGKADTEYTVPDGVTAIGHSAFDDSCSKLASITIPESVTSIGEFAFKNCPNLTELTILNPDCEIHPTSLPSEVSGVKVNGVEITQTNTTSQKANTTTTNNNSGLKTVTKALDNPAITAVLIAVLILLILLLIIKKRKTKKQATSEVATQITLDL